MITLLNVATLITIMLSMGLQVKFEAVSDSARRERSAVLLGTFANYVLIPVITVCFVDLFQANPMASAGLLVLAVCPGAPIGPPLTGIAKGDMPLAIAMMVILAGLSAVLSPLLLRLLLARIAPESGLHIDYLAIVGTLLIAQMVPLAAGLAIHQWAPKLTGGIANPMYILANVLLLSLVVAILATQYETLAAIRFRGWFGMFLLFLASVGLGWFCGGPDVAVRKAMAVTSANRNAAVGLVIATGNFAGTPAVTMVVAYALFSILGTLACALISGRLANREALVASAG